MTLFHEDSRWLNRCTSFVVLKIPKLKGSKTFPKATRISARIQSRNARMRDLDIEEGAPAALAGQERD